MPGKINPKQERFNILFNAQQEGKPLKQEHLQELERMKAEGYTITSGGAGGGGTTEGERKSSAFLTRALGANRDYETIKPGPRGLLAQKFNDAAPNLANVTINDADRQVTDSAQAEFVAATLRYDSGAAIPPAELEAQKRIYFPQPGDGIEARNQKARARARAMQGLIESSGRALDPKIRDQYPEFFKDRTGAGVTPPANGTPPTGTPPNSPAGGPPDETGKYAGADIQMHMDSPENAQGYRFTPTQETALREYLTGGNATPEGYGRMMTAFAAAQGVNVDDAYTQSATTQGQKLIEAAKAGKLGDGMTYTQSDKDYRDSLLAAQDKKPFGDMATGQLLTSGATAGLNDEMSGVVGGAKSFLEGNGFQQGYQHDRDTVRAIRDRAYEKRPIISGATEMLGALVTPGGVARDVMRGGTLAERIAAGAKAGGRQGIAAGYGYGEGAGDSIKGAAIGGATGTLIGGALPVAAKGISSVYNAVTKRPLAAERAAIREAANRQGVNIFPPDIGGPSMKRAAAGLEQSFFGVDRIRRSAEDSVDSFAARARTVAGEPARPVDVGNSMGETASRAASRHGDRARATTAAVVNTIGSPTDTTTAGQIVQRGANQFLPDTADRATQLYNRVHIAPNAETSVDAVRGALREMTGGMQSNPAMRQLFESPRLRNYLEALTPQIDQETGQVIRPGSLSWQDLSEFRTRIGDMLDDPRLSEKIAPRQLRALYAAITTDMETTARQAGPGVYRNWRRANDFYDGRQKRLNDTLSLVLGQRRDATPNEAFARLEQMMSDGPSGNPAAFRRILRTLAPADAATIRATLTSRASGGPNFDAAELAKRWPAISERAKSALLPSSGMRNLMDDAAEQAATAATNPLAGKSGEQIFNAFEAMASSRGDSARFRSTLASMSPEEAAQARATLISRMGESAPGAQNADGDAFSPSRWLTRWQTFTPEAKMALVGNGKMRADMDDLAMLADRMKDSVKFAGHSNTGAINNFNATTGGLGAAVFALLSGHPVIAASLAAPAAYQTIGAKLLTSQRMLNWMTRAPKMRSAESQAAHIARLSSIAAREPAISGDIISLQNYLASKFGDSPLRAAAAPGQDRNDRRPPPENNGQ